MFLLFLYFAPNLTWFEYPLSYIVKYISNKYNNKMEVSLIRKNDTQKLIGTYW